MDIHDATKLMNDLMMQHGKLIADGWTWQWDRSKKRFGLCSYGQKLIKISGPLTRVNPETEVRDTMLHEIAHALVGRGYHHGIVWKLKAQEIGARPVACYSTSNVTPVPAPYTFKCLDCGVSGTRHKAPRTSLIVFGHHRTCKHKANGGKLEWRRQGILMVSVPRELSAPLWQSQQAACSPAPEPKLSQSDISAMWERLKRLEDKL